MSHIVIMGAGVGGLPCAFEMKEALGKKHEVTVIDERDHFQFTPSNPWVAVGWRSKKDICVPLEKTLKRRKINFINSRVEKIQAEMNALVLKNGENVSL